MGLKRNGNEYYGKEKQIRDEISLFVKAKGKGLLSKCSDKLIVEI